MRVRTETTVQLGRPEGSVLGGGRRIETKRNGFITMSSFLNLYSFTVNKLFVS